MKGLKLRIVNIVHLEDGMDKKQTKTNNFYKNKNFKLLLLRTLAGYG